MRIVLLESKELLRSHHVDETMLKLELLSKNRRDYDCFCTPFGGCTEHFSHSTIISRRSYESSKPPKTKASVRKQQSSSDTTMPPPTATGKRLKTSAKVGKPAKEKQPAKSSKAKGLNVLSEVALTEAEQMKLATKRILTQTHISHASGSGADEGTGIIPRVLDVLTYESDDEEISWKSTHEVGSKRFFIGGVHGYPQPVLPDNVVEEEDGGWICFLSGNNSSGTKKYRGLNSGDGGNTGDGVKITGGVIGFDGGIALPEDRFKYLVRRIGMRCLTPAELEVLEKAYGGEGVLAGKGVKGVLWDNDENSHGMNVEGDKLDDERANEEDKANELYRDVNINLEGRDIQMADVQTTQVIKDTHVTLTPVNPEVVQLQSDRLRDEAQAENEDFLNKLDENIQKIIKEQVKEQVKVQVSKILPKIEKTINEQLEAKVLTHSSKSSKTSHAIAADLSELELKKILIDKMESKKSIHILDEQKNLYKALVDAYECDKLILDKYRDTVTLKDVEMMRTKTNNPPLDQTGGPREDEQEKNQSQPAKPPTPDHAWNKTFSATHGRIQHWISNLAKKANSRTSFNELMDTPVDFLAFVMNRLKVDTLTPELLADPTYELMKGSCKSLVELEFFLEEVYKETID
nr:hypothetical protein [Tanacetum cinerariifolium]